MKITEIESAELFEKWSEKYKRSIDCSHPKGFSQRAHCQGRKKHNEDVVGMAEVRIDELYDEKANKPEGGKIDRLVRRSLANKIPVFVSFDDKSTKSGYVRSEHPVKGFLVIGSGRKTYTTFNDETQKATKDADRVYIQSRSTWTASRELDLNEGVMEDSMSLHDWFGKGKHGGAGGGGWDRYNTKGERIGKCGERKSGEGKPKCLSKAKAASLRASGGKKAIAAAVNKKRREDPNPERRGKVINVNSKKKSNESSLHIIKHSVDEKAKSKAQQKVFGTAHTLQKGDEIKYASSKLKKTSKSMSANDVKDFAKISYPELRTKVKR